MPLIVQKYGGTSVGTPDRIRLVAQRLLETQREGCRVVGVMSAMAGITDDLLKLARDVAAQPSSRELDLLLATGEQASSALVAMAIGDLGGRAISLSGAAAGILTDRAHTRAKIANISPRRIQNLLGDDYIVVVAGFQGQNADGEITTLGRGGSDLSAIALAGALNADACQIFTDVDGVFTCDPRLIRDARKIDEISYDELLEMAGGGAKVMQSRAVEFAKKFSVPFEVRSSFSGASGTVAREETPHMEEVVVRGVSVDRKQAKVTICGVPDKAGIAGQIFGPIAAANLIVDMIVQNVSSGDTTDVSFTIHENDIEHARHILESIRREIGASHINARNQVAKLSVVGIGMRSHAGVAARFFECLGHGGINIELISTSEIKIAVVVAEEDIDEAARLTHESFNLSRLAPQAAVI
ncbi:MAG: aspartate kinase [Verrucomicrobia bacterium]|nr:aspartate kinase [Verrucomicrobiota bacterium]